MDDDFISDADLLTFEGWIKYQAVPATSTPEELEMWRGLFDEAMQRRASGPKVGLMKLWLMPGEQKYAIALSEGSDLWLTLWVRCSRKGEVFIMIPRGDRDWDPHSSYHLDGKFHSKSHGRAFPPEPPKRQPLTAAFTGSEHLGSYAGHGKGAGAICDPAAFDGIVIVEPGILGPRHGSVNVDLAQPGYLPKPDPAVHRQIFPRADRPSVVITVLRADQGAVFLHWPDDYIKVA